MIHVQTRINIHTICMYACTHTYITAAARKCYIHTYIHTCMHACIFTYIHTHTHTHALQLLLENGTYIHTCIHTYMHACMHAYIHTYAHTHTHSHSHMLMMFVCTAAAGKWYMGIFADSDMQVCVYMRAYMYICIHEHVCMHMYINVFVYVCIYMYINVFVYVCMYYVYKCIRICLYVLCMYMGVFVYGGQRYARIYVYMYV